MQRFRFEIEYWGSAFAGWQVQQGQATVQGELERAFGIALRQPVAITGAGRTDAGVHALAQVAHCDFPADFNGDLGALTRSINALVDAKICIRNLQATAEDFHARYSAIARSYVYRIYTEPTALYRALGWLAQGNVDFDLMAQEAQSFVGTHDFIDFCIPRHDGKSTVCTISHFAVEPCSEPGRGVKIYITGNRFLHKQIRAMVGLLYDVGRGRYAPGAVDLVFAQRFKGERTWAPAHGLCLQKVHYPSE